MFKVTGHEKKDANAQGIMWVGIGLVISAVLMNLLIYKFFKDQKAQIGKTKSETASEKLTALRVGPPEPRLQKDPQADFKAYHDAQNKILNSYQWIDQKAGVGRIPIERAMEILSNGK